MKLKDFLSTLAESAAHVAQQAAQLSLNNYLSHFNNTKHDNYEAVHDPKIHAVPLLDDLLMTVPEPAMMTPKVSRMERFTLKLETDLFERNGELQVGFSRGLRRRSSHCQIEVEFGLEDGVEGLQLIQERLHDRARTGLEMLEKEGTHA